MIWLQLDYQGGTRPFPLAGVALFALAILVSAGTGVHYHNVIEGTAYWEAKSGVAAHGPTRHSSVSSSGDMAAEIKRANEVLNKITLPWDAMFQAVEWSSGKDVALLAMEPNAERHVVRISAEAKNIPAAMSYLRHLEEQKMFSSVYLQSHQVQQRSADKPVRFTLIATWGATP